MANSKLNLTRDQLALFLKDQESIKQFERLFATVDAIAPDFANEVAISAGTAQATANDALALIDALENSLTADGAVTDAKATLALQELQALKSELQLKLLEPAEQYNNAIITDYLTINEYGHGENAVGRMIWDDGEGTIDFGLKGGNVVCKIGVQEYVRAYNDTLLTMTKGQVVYISGAQGNRVAVKLAQADSEANSAHTIGIVAETISNGGEGFVQVSGPIYKLNTLGTIAGDTLYLSPTIAGAFTTTKPVAPDQLVILGFIERVHATVGSIFIKVDNGYELDELHNVKITSVQPDDLLQYDSAGPYWKNVAPSAISIGTATNLAGGATGSVPYQTAASTTTFLGIGAANYVLTSTGTAPTWTLNTGTGSVVRATSPTLVTPLLGTPQSGVLTSCTGLPISTGVSGLGTGIATWLGTPSSANLLAAMTDETGTGLLVFGTSPTITTPTITTSATVPLVIGGTGTTSTLSLRSTSGVGTTGADIIFQTGNNGATEAMRILNNGNVGIAVTSPAYRVDIDTSNAGGSIWRGTRGTSQLGAYQLNNSTGYVGMVSNHSLAIVTNDTERLRIDTSGNVLVTGIGGLGYGTGSGGAVTQATSRTTGVTLDKTNGAITLVSAAGTIAWQTFTVTNNKVAATDTVIVNQKSGTDLYQIFVTNVAAGSFKITFATTGGITTEQPVFNFAIIKAVTS